jgi:hypothetical protein
MNALTNELLNGVFDIARVTVVNETPGKISYQTTVALKFAQDQPSPVAREISTSEIYLYFSFT